MNAWLGFVLHGLRYPIYKLKTDLIVNKDYNGSSNILLLIVTYKV